MEVVSFITCMIYLSIKICGITWYCFKTELKQHVNTTHRHKQAKQDNQVIIKVILLIGKHFDERKCITCVFIEV